MSISRRCLAVASMIVLSVIGGSTSASSRSRPQDHEEVATRYDVIKLHGKLTHYKRSGSAGRATGVGDQVLISEKIFQNGREYGFSTVMCTQVTGPANPTPAHPATELCTGVYSLRNGQLTWQNTLVNTRPGTPPPWKTAITGGTGAYANARGYIDADGMKHNYTVYLEHSS